MHASHRLWISLTLLLLLSSCSEPPVEMRPLPRDAVVLAFGDSLTYGTGSNRDNSYPAVLERSIGRRVINAGVPGERSPAGLERLSELLDEHLPQLVLLCHGGNDLLAKRPDATIKANLAAMIRLARSRGAEVMLIGVPKPHLLLSPAPFYSELAEELGIPYAPEVISEVLGDPKLKSDPIHPNSAGYRVIAERLAERLRESGAIENPG